MEKSIRLGAIKSLNQWRDYIPIDRSIDFLVTISYNSDSYSYLQSGECMNCQATGKFFVHCAGGRHRRGVVGAVYRFNYDKWNLEQALAEMDQYEFGSGYGHGKQRDFVKDYPEQFQAIQAATASH